MPLDTADVRIAVVAARFNHDITDALLEGALRVLHAHDIADDDLHVMRVPGAFELPLAAKRLAQSGRFDVVITLGAVVRGGTPHFDYVCTECARGVMQVSIEESLPVIFGVLTTDDMAQALDRVGGAHGHKGEEAALAALETLSALKAVPR
ncbi:MAG: 6,7-dimethyl-8-ribityllumazine synthase [Thiotrichales bacterium]|nr:6,7-dimethyl-8-ribityllumazine synthase [Thiotrichales bacterium]